MTYEMALALCIVFLVVGIQIFIFRAQWEDFFKTVYQTIQEVVAESRNDQNQNKQTITDQLSNGNVQDDTQDSVKEGLTWERVKDQYAMPLLFVGVFPLYYFIMHKMDFVISEDANMGGIIICAFVIITLLILVLAVYVQNEKNIRRKFWLHLFVTLFIEIGVVFDFHLLMKGYYFESTRGSKSFVASLLFIPLFLSYCNKTNLDWKALQEWKKSENVKKEAF